MLISTIVAGAMHDHPRRAEFEVVIQAGWLSAIVGLPLLLIFYTYVYVGPARAAMKKQSVPPSELPATYLVVWGILAVFVSLTVGFLTAIHLITVINIYVLTERLIASPFVEHATYASLFLFWLDQAAKGAIFDFMEIFQLDLQDHLHLVPHPQWEFRLAIGIWRMFVSIIFVALLLIIPKLLFAGIMRALMGLLRRGRDWVRSFAVKGQT